MSRQKLSPDLVTVERPRPIIVVLPIDQGRWLRQQPLSMTALISTAVRVIQDMPVEKLWKLAEARK